MLGGDPKIKSLLTLQHITPYTKAIRSVYAAAMQTSRLKKAIPKIDLVMDRLIAVIEEKRSSGPVDLQDLCVRLSLDVIGIVALDIHLGGLDGSTRLHEAILDAGIVVSQVCMDLPKQMYYKFFPFSKGAQMQRKTVNRLLDEWKKLAKAVREKEDPVDGEEPMWYTLRNTIDPDTGAPLGDKELTTEIATVVIGGMYTTGHQLAWILAYLAADDEIVNRLLEELHDYGLFGPHGQNVDIEILGQLSYLNAIVKEGMRIAHITFLHGFRITKEDTVIMGYRIPKGTELGVPGNRWVGADEDWSDPWVFRPERWLTGEDLSRKRYFPFSYGPRDCAGQKLAMLEMRMAIIRLIKRFRFRLKKPLSELTQRTRSGFSTEAVDGIWVEVSPRSPST